MQTQEFSFDARLEDLAQRANRASGPYKAGTKQASRHLEQHLDDFTAAMQGMLALALDRGLTDEQRQRAREELEQWLSWSQESL